MLRQRQGECGQTVVIGALLLFALAVSVIIYLQISVLPDVNQETELDAQSEAVDSMLELRATIDRAATDNFAQSSKFMTTISYTPQPAGPSDQTGQFLFDEADAPQFNPSGTSLNTSNEDMIDEMENDETRLLTYKPAFVELDKDVEIIYDNNLIVEKEEDGDSNVIVGEQQLISGTTINVVTLHAHSDGLQTVNPHISVSPIESLDSSTVDNDGENFELVIDSKIPEKWEDDEGALEAEIEEGYVEDVWIENNNEVHIELDGSQTYTVNYGKVDLRT